MFDIEIGVLPFEFIFSVPFFLEISVLCSFLCVVSISLISLSKKQGFNVLTFTLVCIVCPNYSALSYSFSLSLTTNISGVSHHQYTPGLFFFLYHSFLQSKKKLSLLKLDDFRVWLLCSHAQILTNLWTLSKSIFKLEPELRVFFSLTGKKNTLDTSR